MFDAAKGEAEKRGLTLAHFVERCLRVSIPQELPETAHVTREQMLETERRKQLAPIELAAQRTKDAVFGSSRECECGNSKSRKSKACDRCLFLDGRRQDWGIVIDAMRGSRGMSLLELCEATKSGVEFSNHRRAMLRTMQTLMEQGRVRRYWREGDEFAVSNAWGRGANSCGAGGCWAYVLTEPARSSVRKTDVSAA